MVGWYAPVEVVDEARGWEKMDVVVQMRLVAVGWKADGYTGAVARCSRSRPVVFERCYTAGGT